MAIAGGNGGVPSTGVSVRLATMRVEPEPGWVIRPAMFVETDLWKAVDKAGNGERVVVPVNLLAEVICQLKKRGARFP